MARIQEEITKTGRFLRPSELNWRLLSAINLSQNLLGTLSEIYSLNSFWFIMFQMGPQLGLHYAKNREPLGQPKQVFLTSNIFISM